MFKHYRDIRARGKLIPEDLAALRIFSEGLWANFQIDVI